MSAPDRFSETVAGIERQAIERYSKRLAQFGEDPRTLGWDTRAHQWTRFAAEIHRHVVTRDLPIEFLHECISDGPTDL